MPTLEMRICDSSNKILDTYDIDEKWFCLKNGNLDNTLFKRLLENLKKIFIDEFGIEGAKTYIKEVKEFNNEHLFINEIKVPNIIKHIVYDNRLNVTMNLIGKNPDGDIEMVNLETWDRNKCLKLVPFYHGVERTNSDVSKQNTRKAV